MGTPSRTDRVLEDARQKVSQAEELVNDYKRQQEETVARNRELEEANEKLRASILANALQNANADLRKEHMKLKQTLESYKTKIDSMREIALIAAKVVDSRIKTKQGRQYVEYKLQIDTDIRGTLVLWHRYSTFLNLASTLKAKNPNSEHMIPELQSQSLTGFFSDQLIAERIAKLNEFLDVVTKADEFQWGIRIDKDTCVYKRRSRNRRSSSTNTTTTRESLSQMMMTRESTMSVNDF